MALHQFVDQFRIKLISAPLVVELDLLGVDGDLIELERHRESEMLDRLILKLLAEALQGPIGLEGIALPASRKEVRDIVNPT